MIQTHRRAHRRDQRGTEGSANILRGELGRRDDGAATSVPVPAQRGRRHRCPRLQRLLIDAIKATMSPAVQMAHIKALDKSTAMYPEH